MKESENRFLRGTNCDPKSKEKRGECSFVRNILSRQRSQSRKSVRSIRKLKKSQIPSYVRNIRRRQRRKRSRNTYYRDLRDRREHRKYEELNSQVKTFTVFDISSDMEWKPVTSQTVQLSQDVAEWHQKEQVAYWKSRAISLEYENRMLHKHLRDVYAQHIENYKIDSTNHSYFQELGEGSMKTNNANNEFETETLEKDENPHYSRSRFSNKFDESTTSKHEKIAFEPPSEPVGRKRRQEMENLYGSNCPRIAGIETALQLNFEHTFSKLKPVHWPHLQLNLG